MDKKPVKARQTNMELLRIVSMLLVITLHFFSHGGILVNAQTFSKQYYFSWIVEGFAIVAFNCFILISGYFLIESKFKVKKLFVLIGEVLLYSIIIYFSLVATGTQPFSKKEMNSALLPTLSNVYNFFTVYIGMYILSPFLNIAIKAMTKRQLLACIIIEIIFFSVWTNIIYYSPGLIFGGGWGIVWFIVLYTIAAYLRLYYQPSSSVKKQAIIYISTALFITLCKVVSDVLQQTAFANYINQDTAVSLIFGYNSVPVLLSSVMLFVLFININIKNRVANKIILFLSPLTFGVYLIHDNPFLRPKLWAFINPPVYLQEWYFPLFMLAVVVSIFIVCALIDFLRKKLFDYIFSRNWFNRFCERVEKTFRAFVTWAEHFTADK